MRHPVFAALCLTGTALLSACGRDTDAEVEKVIKDVNVIDESNLSDIMLTVGDPNEAVTYFANTLKQNPDRPDLRRGCIRKPRSGPYAPSRWRSGWRSAP